MPKIYVCRMCGRAIKANKEEQPKYCYADRMDNLHDVSEEDAEKMKIVFPEYADGVAFELEFPGDMYWHPVTGEKYEIHEGMRDTLKKTLSEEQSKLLERAKS